MSGSLTTVVTTAQQIVQALNQQSQNASKLAGSTNFTGLTAQTVVSQNAGRLVNIAVIVGGSTTGTIYDASSTATATAARALYVIPSTIGIYSVNLPVKYGIVVSPGTGMTVSGSYS